MLERYNVSVVSYTNTLPFRIGMETCPHLQNMANFTYDNPAVCAQNLKNKISDIGLVPVAVLAELPSYHIISDYCIGANGKVGTVKLYGNVPVEQMTEIILDNQSRTSVELVKMLAQKHWGISPRFINASDGFEKNTLASNQGMVVIGDRTFLLDGKFKHQYDLAEVWYNYSGLPFVFAMWVSCDKISDEFVKTFDKALKRGVERVGAIAEQYANITPSEVDLGFYLSECISYKMDENKMKAFHMFLDYIKTQS